MDEVPPTNHRQQVCLPSGTVLKVPRSCVRVRHGRVQPGDLVSGDDAWYPATVDQVDSDIEMLESRPDGRRQYTIRPAENF